MSSMTNPNKKVERTNKFLLFSSFAIPFFIMYIATIVMHITPFGNHNLALTDGKYYLNGLMFHSRLLRGQENYFYSFSNLGGNTWASMSWGEFNPVKLLSLFADIDTIPSWFTWISLTNMSVCGLTMYIFLSGLFGKKKSHLIFSTSYAMMGFNVANCFQVLFFIGPQILPLMALGLIKLLKGKSPLLYILSLFSCIFCNFYFGLMLCIASIVIYLSYNYAYTFESKHKRIGVFKVYAISSLIAGLMASFFWLPALKAFSGGGRLNQTTASEYQFSENMPFVQIFAKLFTGANSALEEIQGLPNIFCGIIVVALVILFFMNKNICLKYKRSAAVVLTLYLLSFYIKAFTLVMHGFTHTNWFPYRYSFVFSFFLIWISVYEFKYIEQIGISDIKRCGIIILLSSIVIFSNRYEFISGGDVLIDLLILSLIFFIFYFWKTHKTALINKIAIYLLAFLVFVNLFANYIISIKKLQKEDGWELDIETYQNNTLLSGALIDGINGFDSDFFRMEKDFSESESIGADPLLYNYNGVSGSGPTIRAFVHKELNKLGINWFDMRHWYSKGIPAATDALLGLKYLLSDKDLTEEKGYEQLVNIGESFIYKNPYALSIAILSDTEAERLVLNNNVFENLNNIWKSMVRGSKNIFVEEKDITFTLYNSKAGRTITSEELSSSVSNSIAESVAALDSTHSISSNTNEEPTMSYIESKFIAKHDGPVYYFDQSVPASDNGRSVPCIEFVGMFKKGDIVTHHFIVGDDITWQKMMEYASTLIYAYANNDVLSEYAAILNQNDLTLQVPHENNLVGTFSADDNQCILFTMPWDEGWTCYIDGQKATINKTWNLFMSVDVPKGQHTYEMKFFPAWMDYGIFISVAALIVLIIFMFHWNNTHSISRYILSHNSITDEDSCDLNNTDNSIIISDSIELVKESETNIENYTNEGIK